ncbi:hypothetical protein FRB97_007446 [Tulasnella sp. 331]|nr:hypothetical protein FRB97_007446 [Tulasnella sp. 331]
MDRLLQGPSKISQYQPHHMVAFGAQCCIKELYGLSQGVLDSTPLAKKLSRWYCNYDEPLTGVQCIACVLGPEKKARKVVARAVLVCETPRDATLNKRTEVEDASLRPQKREVPEDFEVDEASLVKKRQGSKGPDPLSLTTKKAKEPIPRRTFGMKESDLRASDGNDSDDARNEESSHPTTPGVMDGLRKSRGRKSLKRGTVQPHFPRQLTTRTYPYTILHLIYYSNRSKYPSRESIPGISDEFEVGQKACGLDDRQLSGTLSAPPDYEIGIAS